MKKIKMTRKKLMNKLLNKLKIKEITSNNKSKINLNKKIKL